MLKRISGEKDKVEEKNIEGKEENNVATELESLRSILYGNQAKATESRLDALSNHVDSIHKELSAQITQGLSELRNSVDIKISSLKKELTDQLASEVAAQKVSAQRMQKELSEEILTQSDQQTTALRAAQRQQSESLDNQNDEQTGKLRALQKTLTDRVDTLSSDLQTKTISLEKDFSGHLLTLKSEQGKQIQDLETTTKRQNDELKKDLLLLATTLESNKVSGKDLSSLLIELGHRLQKPEENNS